MHVTTPADIMTLQYYSGLQRLDGNVARDMLCFGGTVVKQLEWTGTCTLPKRKSPCA